MAPSKKKIKPAHAASPPPRTAAGPVPAAPSPAELVIWENIQRYGRPSEAHDIFAPLAGLWGGRGRNGAEVPTTLRAEGRWIMDRRFLRLHVFETAPGALKLTPLRESFWLLGYDVIQRRHTLHCLEPGGRLLKFTGHWDHASGRLNLDAHSDAEISHASEGALTIAIGEGGGFSIRFDDAQPARLWEFTRDSQGAALETPRHEPDRNAFGDQMIDWEGDWQGPARRLLAPGGRVIESATTMRARFIQQGQALTFSFRSPLEGYYYESLYVIAADEGGHGFTAAVIDNFGSGVSDLKGPWDTPARTLTLEGEWSDYLRGRREPTRIAVTRTLHGLLVIDMAVPDDMGRFERIMNVALLRHEQTTS